MARCEQARIWWQYALSIIYSYCGITPVNGCWSEFTWQQCVMGSKLPRWISHAKVVWSLLRGSTIWLTWIDRNMIAFNSEVWPQQKIHQLLWETALDWMRTKELIHRFPACIMLLLNKFDKTWGVMPLFGNWVGLHVNWNHN